jgi:hypothetical protein
MRKKERKAKKAIHSETLPLGFSNFKSPRSDKTSWFSPNSSISVSPRTFSGGSLQNSIPISNESPQTSNKHTYRTPNNSPHKRSPQQNRSRLTKAPLLTLKQLSADDPPHRAEISE